MALSLPSLLSLLLCATSARAVEPDPFPSLDLRGYRPSTDPGGTLFLEPAVVPAHGDYNLGLSFSYARTPIILRKLVGRDEAYRPITDQLTADLVAGVGAWGRASFGLDLPFALYQVGDAPNYDSIASIGEYHLPQQALGDLGFTGKLVLVNPTAGSLGGFALSLHERFTVPTGDRGSFLGEGAVTSTTRIFAEYRLFVVGVQAAVGVKLRAEVERFACGDVPVGQDEKCRQRVGHEVPFALGVSLRPQALGIDPKGRYSIFVESQGHVPIYPGLPFEGRGLAAVEVGAGARAQLGDFALVLGASTGIVGMGTGPVRAMLSFSWAPRVRDADNDGVPDELDQCRELAEDKDGFEDDDGCPDGDNDDDGVPDGEDKCPKQKEDEDGIDDDDGCSENGWGT
jgi:hypothetical protein